MACVAQLKRENGGNFFVVVFLPLSQSKSLQLALQFNVRVLLYCGLSACYHSTIDAQLMVLIYTSRQPVMDASLSARKPHSTNMSR